MGKQDLEAKNNIALSVASPANSLVNPHLNVNYVSPADKLAIDLLNSLDINLPYSADFDHNKLAQSILNACKEQDESNSDKYINKIKVKNKNLTVKKVSEEHIYQDKNTNSSTSIGDILNLAHNRAMYKHNIIVSSEHGDESYEQVKANKLDILKKIKDERNNLISTINIPKAPKSSLYQANLNKVYTQDKDEINKELLQVDLDNVNEDDSFDLVHYRGGHMPCYFLYDYASDRYLLDEGSCRLLGLTYTGDWMLNRFIEQQIDILDEDGFFKVLFGQVKGDMLFSEIRIKQGPHQGERLYMNGSVVERDDTGIALLVTGYLSKVQANFIDCMFKIKNHACAFDIDTFTGEIHFGSEYKNLLGLVDKDELPQTLVDFENRFIHPDDLPLYRKQSAVITDPSLGDYFECIYRLRHNGGYYIWCIDRALIVERKRSGKASRVIGTTTNIDVVRSNFERLKRSIYQDPLTGLHNRLYLNTRYQFFTMEECQPLTLVYADISGLKVINDNLGHAKGDELVKLAANILQNDIYLDHEVVRLSGDEFLLIFTNCDYVQCKHQINKLVVQLEERNKEHLYTLPIYFGFGIATLHEIDDGDTFIRCEARADARLHEYKTNYHNHIYEALQNFIENALGHKISLVDNRRLNYLNEDNEDDLEFKVNSNPNIKSEQNQVHYTSTLDSLYNQDIKEYVPNKSAKNSASVFLEQNNSLDDLVSIAEKAALEDVQYTQQSLTIPSSFNLELDAKIAHNQKQEKCKEHKLIVNNIDENPQQSTISEHKDCAVKKSMQYKARYKISTAVSLYKGKKRHNLNMQRRAHNFKANLPKI